MNKVIVAYLKYSRTKDLNFNLYILNKDLYLINLTQKRNCISNT